MYIILKYLESLLGIGILVLIVSFLLIINSWIFKKIQTRGGTLNFLKSSISLIVVLLGTIIFIFLLPIDKSLKGQIISFLGIIISAGIALSSTTILGNLIAGIMNNSINRFKIGDLINVGDYQGKVTMKNIFYTEIQLEDSNFVTFPNLFIASNPVKLTRKTKTVIAASVSLGYDVSRIKIEEALKEAALDTGLHDPYVYITSLGDYSVCYKIHGFLDDCNKFFTTRSHLNANVMDMLHQKKIEIVSPIFMNQRAVDKKVFIPIFKQEHHWEEEKLPEELIFDKAIKSEEIEKKKAYLKQIDQQRNDLSEKIKSLENESEIESVKKSIQMLENIGKRIEQNIKESKKDNT